ncbi:unnamed protein product [Caenorhabditis sp. 36 PRJEB53466]|nr:unnamed protein product [Caenorhabditis sp. 36 PRJEB53466]
MSEEILKKFLTSIEQEDGITEVGKKKKKNKSAVARENVKTILQAAAKGQVQLSAEENYIVQKPSTSKGTDYIDDRLASQGFSLIDQARSFKPKDLKKRNLKYMKYQESRRLDKKKGRVLVAAHMKTKTDLKNLRKEKKEIIGVKEPKRSNKKKQKSKSVFSDADFAQVAHVAKRVNSLGKCEFQKISGPHALPIIGSAYQFKLNNRKFTYQLEEWAREFGMSPNSSGVISVWIGPIPIAVILAHEAMRPLLESTENITKPVQYGKIMEWIGTGLLTSTNEKWRQRRKMLTPTFHFNVLQRYQEVFAQQGLVLVDLLNRRANNQDVVNIFPYIKRCALDIICETAMGAKVNAQVGSNNDYVDAVGRISEIIWNYERFPWLWAKPVWYLTGLGFEFDRLVKMTNDFTRKVITSRKTDFDESVFETTNDPENPKGKRLAFLDFLLKMQSEGKLSDEDIREEVDTFMFEGHDTTASGMAFTIWWLGQYPEYQRKVHEEIDEVFGEDTKRLPTNEDIKKLVYLEKCIKEALRLFPSVPLIARKLTEDLLVPHPIYKTMRLPKGLTVLAAPLGAARDPREFERPEEFFPDHFDSDRVARRDPYAYVPFSAGPRNCIGQKFAILEEKTVLSWIFRRFEVSSVEHWPEGRPVPELILRPYDGVKMILKNRRRL